MRLVALTVLALSAAHCVGGDYSLGGNALGGAPSGLGEAGGFMGDGGGSFGAAGGGFEAGGSGTLGGAGSGGMAAPIVSGQSGAGAGSVAMAGGGADGGARSGAGGAQGGGVSALGGGIAVLGSAGAEGSMPLSCETEIVTRCLDVWALESVDDSASDAELSALFPHPSAVAFTNSQLNAINASGTIVGIRNCGNATRRATRFENREAQELISDIDAEYSEALDINDEGVVVGHLARRLSEMPIDPFTRNRAYHAFIWKDGVTRVLDELGPVKVVAINKRGQVLLQRTSLDAAHALFCETQACGVARAILWQDGQVVDIGTLGGASTQPYDLDDAGRVLALSQRAGSQLPNDRFVVALWENGELRQLPIDEPSYPTLSDSGELAVGLGIWNGREIIRRGPDVFVDSALLTGDGSTVGTYEHDLFDNPDGFLSRPFVFTGGHVVPLWGVVEGNTFTGGSVNDANGQGIIIGEGTTNDLRANSISPRAEVQAHALTRQAVVWSADCYHGCCSATGDAGGDGSAGNAGLEGGQQ